MFRDRLLIISFFISLFINTLAVCVIGGVTLRPPHFGAEPAKKNTLRPVRIGSYKPPKAPQVRPAQVSQPNKATANKANKAQAKNAPRAALRPMPQTRIAKSNQSQFKAPKAAINSSSIEFTARCDGRQSRAGTSKAK